MVVVNLFVLFDDIVILMDDIVVMFKVVVKKIVGVLGDDFVFNVN